MQRNHLKLLSLLAVTALCLCSVAVIMEDSDDSDAVITTTAPNDTLTSYGDYSKTISVNGMYTAEDYSVSGASWLSVNSVSSSSVTLKRTSAATPGTYNITFNYAGMGGTDCAVTWTSVVTPTTTTLSYEVGDSFSNEQIGLSGDAISGNVGGATLSSTYSSGIYKVYLDGTITSSGTYNIDSSNGYVRYSITVSQSTIPVTSVSIATPTAGHTMTLTATTSPTNASDHSVTWTITAGSSYVDYSTSTTSTGGKITLTPTGGYGTITVKATANDGSGKYATKSVYVGELIFDANGGYNEPDPIYWIGTSSTSSKSITIDSGANKSGVDFIGWSTSSSGSASYEVGDSYSIRCNSQRILYAIYGLEHDLTFNKNGGTGTLPDAEPVMIAEDDYEYITIPSSGYTLSKTNYNLAGWDTSSSGTTVVYSPGDNVRVDYGDNITLYAVWTLATKDIVLSFDANGGSGAPASITKTTTATSEVFTIPSGTPTRSGYQFKGWSESSTATSASYVAGNTITLSANKTLHAVWSQIISITSTPTDKGVVGETYSYTVSTNVSGATVSVSGASWLSVSGSTISGKPTASGTYNITVTVTKSNCVTATQDFTITVYSSLGFNSAPSASGIFAYVK